MILVNGDVTVTITMYTNVINILNGNKAFIHKFTPFLCAPFDAVTHTRLFLVIYYYYQ